MWARRLPRSLQSSRISGLQTKEYGHDHRHPDPNKAADDCGGLDREPRPSASRGSPGSSISRSASSARSPSPASTARCTSPGDAAATAGNLVANAGLVKIGVAADLIQVTVWVFLALTLYVLLRHVSGYAARAMVVLVAIGASLSCLNILFEFQGMRVATDPTYTATVGAAGATALAMVMLDLQHYGYAIAGIFFGLWLVPLGYLAFGQACSRRCWASCSSSAASATCSTRSPRSWPPSSPRSSTRWLHCLASSRRSHSSPTSS